MRIIFIVGFVVMVIAQWYAPVSMILTAQRTIDNGSVYKFKTRPVDPSDPFRGKYVTLDYEQESHDLADPGTMDFSSGQIVYAVIVQPGDYATIQELSADPPEDGQTYIEAKVLYASPGDHSVELEFPFKRFYLEESKASEAEQLYWRTRSDSAVVCYAEVKVLDGDAKLVDVIINDSSIVDVVRRINASKPD